jgi:hypothetical protein
MDVALVVRARAGERDAFAQLATESIDRLDATRRAASRTMPEPTPGA